MTAEHGVHLAIDAVGAKDGGAASVLKSIVAAALANADVRKITVFMSPREERDFILPATDRIDEKIIIAPRGLKRIIWLSNKLRSAVSQASSQVLLCLGNGGIGPKGIPSAVLVQQSIPFSKEAIRLLSIQGKVRIAAIKAMMRYSCKFSDIVVVQSPTMSDWVERQLGVTASKIKIFQPSVKHEMISHINAPELAAMKTIPEGERLLYVGNMSPHKNVKFLVQSVRSGKLEGMPGTLFMTCPPTHPLCDTSSIIGLGTLHAETLWGAYELADVLVMPSLVETVGLPMLEAAAVGTPILAADRPYAHDTCGDAALYFDPLRSEDFIAKLTLLLSDKNLRRYLVEKGLDLAAKRENERPYDRLVEILVGTAKKEIEISRY